MQLDGATSVILSQGAKITSMKDLEVTVIGDFDLNVLGRQAIGGIRTDIRGSQSI